MGITKIFSSVDVMRPPKTTIAIGLWISLPGLSPLKTKGMSANAEVRRTANTPPISAKGRLTSTMPDIGCGGGANIARLLQRTFQGTVTGIDFSPVSVRKSTKVNAKAIQEGRCKVLEGNVANLPFADGSFDVVTAFETIYFWPDIEHCFNEVKRVLKPGGQFVIVNESDGSGAMDAKWESMIEGMHTYTPEEIRLHLTNVGFRDLNITVNEEKRWLCATARK
jgi:Methylase involved in ubiquinone/menaquinone biosynthesis